MKTTLTIDQLVQAFISDRDVSDTSKATYLRELKMYWRYIKANNIANPTRQTIIEYKNYLASNKSQATADNYLTVVKLFYKWANEKGYNDNIATGIKRVSKHNTFKKQILSDEQVRQLVSAVQTDTIKGLRDYAILSLMITGGLRTIEVSRADVGDIDSNILYLQRKGHREKDSYVTLSDNTIEAIHNYLVHRDNIQDNQPLFTSISNRNNSQRMQPKSLSAMINTYIRAAGITDRNVSAHSLRHTVAVHMIINGYDINDVRLHLGHCSTAVTELYTHYANEYVLRQKLKGSKLDELFNISPNKAINDNNIQGYSRRNLKRNTKDKQHTKQFKTTILKSGLRIIN